MTILDRVRSIAADLFHLPEEKITPASSPEHIDAWDSVQHLNLVLALETEYSIEFAPEEFDQMKTVGSIAALVESKLG